MTSADSPGTKPFSRRRKILISVFILFHWACVIAWILPKPSPIKTFLLGLKAPLPGIEKAPGEAPREWTMRLRPVAASYLQNSGQWQEWAMFSPNPLQVNRYVGAQVAFERGNWKQYTFPRLSEMNFMEAWVEKRYRKLQQRLIDENKVPYHEDVARWIARELHEPGNKPVRVTLFVYEAPIPKHDREELHAADAPAWIDYTDLLRTKAKYSPKLLVDYFVQPQDLAP